MASLMFVVHAWCLAYGAGDECRIQTYQNTDTCITKGGGGGACTLDITGGTLGRLCTLANMNDSVR